MCNALMQDYRQCFLPNTAKKLRLKPKNTMKDIAYAAKPVGVTHLQIFTTAPTGTSLRIVRLPYGPTIDFAVRSFETAREILSGQRRPMNELNNYHTAALPILNNFATNDKPHIKMVQTMLTNLFPELRVDKVKLSECKRVILFHLHKDAEFIDVRHYVITGRKHTANKVVKRLEKKRLPKRLNQMKDIADFFTKADAYFSDSDGEAEEVVLAQRFRNVQANSKSLIKLSEIGPRMTLSVRKIMAGFLDGEVLYHSSITKTAEEIEHTRRLRKKKEKEKKARRQAQEAIVADKAAKKEEKKRRRQMRNDQGKSDDESEEDVKDPQPSAYDENDDYDQVEVQDVEDSSEEDGPYEQDAGSPDEDALDDVREASMQRSKRKAEGENRMVKRQKTVQSGFEAGEGLFPRGDDETPVDKKPQVERKGKVRAQNDKTRNRNWIDRKREKRRSQGKRDKW